jgi:4-aminobutyrate aminotransferase-like enzyme
MTHDPAPLLGLSPATWLPDVEAERARRDGVTASAAERYYELPPAIERGWREVLYDTAGRGYLDMVNNVAGVGHGHPRLADAVAQQLLTLNTNNRFLYSSLAAYVERLRELAPHPSLSAVLLVNSGSEAVELALKLAYAHTGRGDVVALREGYHGWTAASDAVSTSVFDNPSALGSRPEHVHVAEAVNPYRNPKSAAEYASGVEALLAALDSASTPVGAFIAEPVFGNGGGVIYPAGYLSKVYDAVHAHGGLCIADEVQVGLGRLGHHAWGVHEQGVVPDIVAVAKALGNAYPLGAVYTTPEIAASLAREGMFFSSAGGATASAVAGLAVLDIMLDEGLQANAAAVGDLLAARFGELMARHPVIGCVHGMGLYQGVELVRDRESKEPATSETAWVCERMLDYGVIIQPTSERQNVLKIKPPLTLTREHAEVFVRVLDAVLGELEERMKQE